MRPPNPAEWLGCSDDERIESVTAYHRQRRPKVPNLRLHATFHAIVENQVALGDEAPVEQTLSRLMEEGLDRHDAVHAIASVLASHVHHLLNSPNLQADPNEAYYAELRLLTAASWRASGSKP